MKLSVLLLAAVLFGACDNVLPQSLEDRIRKNMRESEERDRMAQEVAVVETVKGKFVVRFFGNEVPRSVLHIRRLIDDKFYDNQRVHRSLKKPVPFVVQFGDGVTRGKPGEDYVWDADTTGKPVAGWGQAPAYVEYEPGKKKHTRGAVALARRASDKRGGSQLYIALAPQPHLDNNFTVIGEVIEGMEVVESLDRGDQIKSIRLVEDKRAVYE
jgi:cyclophilin family peptidyl-prolyl cis-trans isomerase